jgi:hypothetical protein
VDQADISSVHAGQPVRIKLDAFASDVIEAEVKREEDVSRQPMRRTPEAMAVQQGGALASQTDPKDPTGGARPQSATYEVKVPLPPERAAEFKIGQRGRAKISAEPRSLAWRCWRFLTRTFRFEL